MSIIRGQQEISQEEFVAHLATLMRIENVGVFLGAGASLSAGGQTMKGIWMHFIRTYPDSAQFLQERNFVSQEAIAPETAEENCPNVEELSDSLEIARIEWNRVAPQSEHLTNLKSAIRDVERSAIQASLLAEDCWRESAHIELSQSFALHRQLLQRLVGARQPGQPAPWVFTTNYDLAVEWAAESVDLQIINGFLGLHHRKFSPQSFDLGFRNTLARGEARFGVYNIYIAKLHGSLTWKMSGEDVVEARAEELWPSIQQFLAGEDIDTGLLVYPRAAKYLQTVGFLLGELIRRYSEFLARPQSCLILNGYSFGDEHLNRILFSALQNPTLQLVVCLPEFGGLQNIDHLRRPIRHLISLDSPRVTVVGGDIARFDQFVPLLPDPLLFDTEKQKIRQLMRELSAPEGEA